MNEIEATNFQGYKKVLLKPAKKGITAITGSSDAGKTTLIRLIEWVRKNRPSGTAFIHRGETECIGRIDSVKRIKKKSLNAYQVGDGQPHKALKTAIPEEVVNALNLGDVNVQTQHESMFLINETGGKAAGQLSELVDLTVVQRVLKNVGDRKRKTSTELSAININIENANKGLKELAWVNGADEALAKIERKQAKLDEFEESLDDLTEAVNIAKQRQVELSKLPDISALEPAKELLKRWVLLEDEEEWLEDVEEIIERASRHQAHADFAERADTLIKEIHYVGVLSAEIEHIENIFKTLDDIDREMSFLKKDKVELEVALEELLGDVCPTCGTHRSLWPRT